MILVAIPYHEQKRYSLEHLFNWISKADLPDCEIVLRVHRGTFGEKDAVKHQREFFRRLAVDKDATHLLFVGADTIPPLDVVPKLLAHKLDVVGGLYYARSEGSLDAVAWRNEPILANQGLVEVEGMGMDCVLLSRKAFTSFSWDDYEITDDDYPVYDKLKAQGFKIMLDTEVICRHYSDKDRYSGE